MSPRNPDIDIHIPQGQSFAANNQHNHCKVDKLAGAENAAPSNHLSSISKKGGGDVAEDFAPTNAIEDCGAAPKPRPRITPRTTAGIASLSVKDNTSTSPAPGHTEQYIPPFYFPYGRPCVDDAQKAEKCERSIRKVFAEAGDIPGQLSLKEMGEVSLVG